MLDVGTGSGAIALAIKAARPDARVTAADVSADALAVAAANAAALGLELELVESDLLAGLAGRRFGLIASNPPYIAEAEMEALEPEVAQFEPRLATVGGASGTEVLDRLIAAAPAALEPGGWLVVECGAGQAPAVRDLMAAAGGHDVFAERDLAGDRAGRRRPVGMTANERALRDGGLAIVPTDTVYGIGCAVGPRGGVRARPYAAKSADQPRPSTARHGLRSQCSSTHCPK